MGHQAGQSSRRIALIDGNSFYASCERALRPALNGKPVIVLSNNDGCAIARTAEAKALGIRMGDPWFKIRHLEPEGLVALSANFALYGDLSERMMHVIGQFSPRQEIYSIDESFLYLTGVPGTGREIGTAIRSRVLQWVGIPTCVGIGPSKTLAKLANHLAKSLPRLEGVCDLSGLSHERLMRAIRHVPVAEVWGVGRRLAPRLQELGIQTAADLACADARVLRDTFSIVMAKTARELAGESCIEWEDSPAPKKQIMCSRSFGSPVGDICGLMEEALSVYTGRAAEKLRGQASMTMAIHVFARTSFFRQTPQYSGSAVIPLGEPTDDTRVLLAATRQALRKFFRPGFAYAKAGVCLLDVRPRYEAQAQQQLAFEVQDSGADSQQVNKAMCVLDSLNTRYGRDTVKLASSVHDETAAWQMRQERMSPSYTTRWEDLVEVWR